MFKLDFVTPNGKIVVDQELAEVTLPAQRGELDILPGHSPLMTTLQPGILTYKLKNGDTGKYAISWGYAQVSERGVNVLAETAIAGTDVDQKADQESLKKLEARLLTETLSDEEWEKVQGELATVKAGLELASSSMSR